MLTPVCRLRALSALAFLLIPATAFAAYYPKLFDPKHGGSLCYFNTYSDAFRKKHPNVTLTNLSIGRRGHISSGAANTKKKFGLTFAATTKSDSYSSIAECTHQGHAISCNLESDGGTVLIIRAGKGVIVKSRRIQIEGTFKDLDIVSKRGGPIRSFTLKGSGKETCDAVFD